MKRTLTTTSLLLGALLHAQAPEVKVPSQIPYVDPDAKTAPAPLPAKTAATPLAAPTTRSPLHMPPGAPSPAAIASQFDLPRDRVLWQSPGDGSLWARGVAYKASFTADGATFIPFFGADAPNNYPMRLSLVGLRADGVSLELPAAAVFSRDSGRVAFDRGAVQEVYEPRPEGLEQMFVLASNPGRGDLVVTVHIQSDLTARQDDAIRFANDHGEVVYGKASLRDAAGNLTALTERLVGSDIEIRVQAAALATAVWPVTIDPIVSSFYQFGSPPNTPALQPDIAYDVNTQQFLVAWEQIYSNTDHDMYAAFVDFHGVPLPNTTVTIDFTGSYWARPRVADNSLGTTFLVVAERGDPASGARDIYGVTVNAATRAAASGQFLVSGGGGSGDKFNADVGGDPNPSPPTYFLVVWERTWSATDHDIQAQLVTSAGGMNGPALSIDNSSAYDTNPAISKSDGEAPSLSQNWAIVWQRAASAADHDLYNALIRWDGQVTLASHAIDTLTWDDTLPVVSTITDVLNGERYYLIVNERIVLGGDKHIFARVHKVSNPAFEFGATDVSALTGWQPGRDEYLPHVDSDGTRFTVCYSTDLFQPSTPNAQGLDAAVLHMLGETNLGLSAQMHLTDPLTNVDGNQYGRIVGTREPSRASRFGCVFQAWTGGLGHSAKGLAFDSYGLATATFRHTACGGLSLSTPAGEPALGYHLTFTLTNYGTDLPLFLFGWPAPATPFCGTCLAGLDLTSAVLFFGSQMTLQMPRDGALIGATFSVQGASVGTFGCPQLPVRTADTWDCTIY